MQYEQRNFTVRYQKNNALQLFIAMLILALLVLSMDVYFYIKTGFNSATLVLLGVIGVILLFGIYPLIQYKYNYVRLEGDALTYFDLLSLPQKNTINLPDIETAYMENNHGLSILVIKDKNGKLMRLSLMMLEEEGTKKLLQLLARLTGQG
jgi:hypothetical protein